MSDIITITGIAATDPRHIVTQGGLDIASFRLASTQRRYDTDTQEWVDGETNWYTVTGFRRLAVGVTSSIRQGEHVIVTGRLRVRNWETDGKTGTNVAIDADAIGHDLTWGTTQYTKTPRAHGDTHEADAPEEPASSEQPTAGTTPF